MRVILIAILIEKVMHIIFRSLKKMSRLFWVLIRKYLLRIRYTYDSINFVEYNSSIKPKFFSVDFRCYPNIYSFFNLSNVRSDADRVCQKMFTCLGLKENSVKNNIMWNKDYLTDFSWPDIYYSRLQPVRYNEPLKKRLGYDRKLPYEISRFQHLPPLCNAFLLFNDRKYPEEAISQITDWISKNKFLYGINWTCAMEVAIRACNWIWAWWIFKDDLLWTDTFNKKFIKSLWQHGWYLEHNLENRKGIITNHYLSDIVGLLFISVMFPQFKDSHRWKKFSINELGQCMEDMVYPDGVNYENSAAYHRLVVELFTYSAILCKKNEIELPQLFWEYVEKMMEFIMYCTRPDGRMPMIGDNDDGRFLILSNYYDWDRFDYRYLLAIASLLFNRVDFKISSGKLWEEVIWIMGEESISTFESL